jgi:hypothetical protein
MPAGAKYLKWGELKSTVRSLLTVDSSRLGIQDTTDTATGKVIPGFISLMIRQAVLDLQHYIPAYRIGHETIYFPQDFVVEGHASRGVLPPLSQIQDIWMCNLSTSERYPVLHDFPWEHRFELVNGMVTLPDNNGRVCIEADAYKFYAYPIITGSMVLSVFWSGEKTNFQDCEETPFDEAAALAVAQYVKGQIAREVENDLPKYNSYFSPGPVNEGSYIKTRRRLYLAAKERVQ